MKKTSLILIRNFIITSIIAIILGVVPTLLIFDVLTIPSINGMMIITDGLEETTNMKVKEIINNQNLTDNMTQKELLSAIRDARDQGLEVANNLFSFFGVYAIGILATIMFPAYVGTAIAIKLSKKWFPMNIHEIKKRQGV